MQKSETKEIIGLELLLDHKIKFVSITEDALKNTTIKFVTWSGITIRIRAVRNYLEEVLGDIYKLKNNTISSISSQYSKETNMSVIIFNVTSERVLLYFRGKPLITIK